MNLSGQTEIAASRQRVWDTIRNPNNVQADSAQGKAQIEKIDDTHYRINATAPGMMAVNVVLELELTELDEPNAIGGTISGNVMGSAIDGRGGIRLDELGPKLTGLHYEAEAKLGGMLGGFEPMIAGPLQQAADQSVASLKERLEAEEAAAG